MKNYICEVTAKGGAWRGMRRRFAVGPIAAASKSEAESKALDMAEADRSIGEYDTLVVSSSKTRVTQNTPA